MCMSLSVYVGVCVCIITALRCSGLSPGFLFYLPLKALKENDLSQPKRQTIYIQGLNQQGQQLSAGFHWCKQTSLCVKLEWETVSLSLSRHFHLISPQCMWGFLYHFMKVNQQTSDSLSESGTHNHDVTSSLLTHWPQINKYLIPTCVF